jgi:hypothetical protein
MDAQKGHFFKNFLVFGEKKTGKKKPRGNFGALLSATVAVF